jgi:hypothetical protein
LLKEFYDLNPESNEFLRNILCDASSRSLEDDEKADNFFEYIY